MARNTYAVDESLEKDAEFNFGNLVRLKKYMASYMKKLLIAMVVTIVLSIFGLMSPYLLKITIDDYIPAQDYTGIIAVSSILLAAQIASIFLLRFKIYEMAKIGQGIIRDLRLDIFKHMQSLPFSYYDSRPHGKILVRVVNYVNSLSDMMSNGVVNMVTDLFSLVFILIIMLFLNVQMTLISLAAMPFLILAIAIIKNKARLAWRISSSKSSNLVAYLHESLAGMKITQSFVRENTNEGILNNVSGSFRQAWLKAVSINFFLWPSIDNISTLSICSLYMAGIMWLTGAGIELGVLVAFIGYVGRFWGPIANLANFYNSIVVNMSYLERIFETIDEPAVVEDREKALEMPEITGSVEFDNVTFSYDPGRPILKNVSFTVNAGDTIALVGPTGAGKTTVVNLISRFYNIEQGRVLVDGADIADFKLNSLRRQMGIMLQDSFIFSGTVMDNIRYGRLDATDDEVIAAAKAVCAHDFISAMDQGYKTEVNERGSRLSAGQRQLISFARLLLADPKILILDEATSSIDTKTELLLQEGLNKLLEGRTSFVIAHRLSTIKNATKIMYIDMGAIVEAGTHEELVERQGAYYDLNMSQYSFLSN